MSSATGPSTFRNNKVALACTGFCFAVLQTVFFREQLSVFSGNELTIGIILSLWLLGTGASMRFSSTGNSTRRFSNISVLVALLCVAAVWGFFSIRAARLVFGGGVAFGPLATFVVALASSTPITFVNGVLLAKLFSAAARDQNAYGWETLGSVVGAIAVFLCILTCASSAVIAAMAMTPFLFVVVRRSWLAAMVVACIAILMVFDAPSLAWKYGAPVSRVVEGREGEIAYRINGIDTTILLNATVYASPLEKPQCEQAVHIPMAQRPYARRALVVFDRGHSPELAKYPGLNIDIVESDPLLAARAPHARVAAVESIRPDVPYDIVFIGAGRPQTASANRFYTRSFFKKIKSILSDSGLITFSLPFSENYLSPSERRLRDALVSTLGSVWRNVAIFPGEGFTFMASDGSLELMPKIRISTRYLASAILPGASLERLRNANLKPARPIFNTHDKPVTLFLGLTAWLDVFPGGSWILAALFVVCFLAALAIIPKTGDSLSVASSGLTAGVYSVSLLILYQATYGALYSRVSLLLMSLMAGFAIGSLFKKFPLSDFCIGLYSLASLSACAMLPFPPAFLFYMFHAGIGVLCGAQIMTRPRESLARLYGADLLGGAIGMAICSTVLVPLLGIIPVAAGLFALKTCAGAGIFYFDRSKS